MILPVKAHVRLEMAAKASSRELRACLSSPLYLVVATRRARICCGYGAAGLGAAENDQQGSQAGGKMFFSANFIVAIEINQLFQVGRKAERGTHRKNGSHGKRGSMKAFPLVPLFPRVPRSRLKPPPPMLNLWLCLVGRFNHGQEFRFQLALRRRQ